MLLLDGEHSAGFLNDLGVNIEDINVFGGKVVVHNSDIMYVF